MRPGNGLAGSIVFLTNGDYNEASFALYRKEISLSPIQALRLGETRREEAFATQAVPTAAAWKSSSGAGEPLRPIASR